MTVTHSSKPSYNLSLLNPLSHPEFTYEAGNTQKRRCVGTHSGIRKEIISASHDSAVGGHSGIHGTYQRVKAMFFWPRLKEEVHSWVGECETCRHENNPYPQLLYPLPICPYLQSQHTKVEELVQKRMKMLQLLKDNLCKAQQRMKLFVDKHRSERKFEVRDYVFLKLQPYRQISIALRRKLKLSARYYGPYEVVQRIGKVAYRFLGFEKFGKKSSNMAGNKRIWKEEGISKLGIQAKQDDTVSRDLHSASGEHVANDLKGGKSSNADLEVAHKFPAEHNPMSWESLLGANNESA
ncbi:UNVERIFIED_CONTAM: hypothetical protein Sradi_3560500 [Sesamum radiatum]|uniref:Integrase zinc-binding domain-containing protein n=1 Tax=Sesamum radiatum TaxID=300843 RepID=A0AAW2QFQ2_SESRA